MQNQTPPRTRRGRRPGIIAALTALFAFLTASAASAQDAAATAVTAAVGDAATSLTSMVTSNLGVILGVTVAFLAIPVGKKLIKSARG